MPCVYTELAVLYIGPQLSEFLQGMLILNLKFLVVKFSVRFF